MWLVADTPTEKVRDLIHSDFATRSRLELTFEEDERGKRACFGVRRESGTVKKRPTSDIVSAVIP
jgi:hypothetical protein